MGILGLSSMTSPMRPMINCLAMPITAYAPSPPGAFRFIADPPPQDDLRTFLAAMVPAGKTLLNSSKTVQSDASRLGWTLSCTMLTKNA